MARLIFLYFPLTAGLWHSDTSLKQNKLANDITNLETRDEDFFEWFKFGFIVLRKHWNELDFYRINKFMYLARTILTTCFKKIEEKGFKKPVVPFSKGLHSFQRGHDTKHS